MDNRTKILMLTERFFPLSTPSAQRSFAYAKTIYSHSYGTIIVTKSPVDFKSEKTVIIGQSFRREIPVFDPIALVLYFIKSISIIRKHSIGLVISTIPKINNAFVGFLLSMLFRIPHIIDVRDYWECQLLSYPAKKIVPRHLVSLLIQTASFVYRKASSLITVNETLREMLHERGIPYNRIHVVPNGIDTALFKPCETQKCIRNLRKKYMLPQKKTIFLYAGSLAPSYKVDLVLRAIGHLMKKNDFMFLIIGRPTLLVKKEDILQTVKKSGVEKNVRIMDSLPLDETAELHRCCDVGVIPLEDQEYLKCMITVKLFAYLASGLPVLVSGPKHGELEKFLNKYEVGLFIGKPTPHAFSEGFKKFIQQTSRTKSMGRRGRRIVKNSYDRYALSQRIIPIIQDLIHSQT